MAASVPPSPKLGKSQALNVAQNTVQRLATIIPTLTTELSPVTVYQPGAGSGVGNQMTAEAGLPVSVTGSYGVWVAPDLYGNGQEYYVQVECFGAGGGGGGGNASAGGGGGGGGEYACEPQYPVKPGQSYGYVVGLPGTGGVNNITEVNPGSAGTTGGTTLFDTDHGINANSLANGVIAHGGTGGDQNSVGTGGDGGSGSTNSIHFNGGAGGTNNSLHGSDSPLNLAQVSGMFVGNTLSPGIISDWLILNDIAPTGGLLNDNTGNENWGYVTNYSNTPGGPGLTLAGTTAPPEVPAYASAANPPTQHNATAAGEVAWFKAGQVNTPSCVIEADAVFAGNLLTISCWIQCDPTGTWGNTATGSYSVIVANTTNYNGNAMEGYALFLHQDGSPSAPSWSLVASMGNGSSRTFVSTPNIGQTPGTWIYVVMTYDNGLLTLYVNGASAGTATSSGYTSVPGGNYPANIGMDPDNWINWFFGSIANIWWANDCATTALVSAAYGGVAPTGGAGGGASGGPSANGGTGGSAGGSTGGAIGTPATQPASLASTTTEAMSGYPGANGGSGFAVRRFGSSTTTVTQSTGGTYTQTLPEGVTVITAAKCWGAGSGGNGGNTGSGGSGGSGGEYAAETTYTPQQNPFTYVVGGGGSSASTGQGSGGNGGDSFIDDTGIYAHGATTSGGTGSSNTTHENGGTGGTASSTGGGSGGNSGNSTGAGNAGVASSTSTGAASPAAQSGSGTGGAGGSNNASGSTGGSPGAGGGGAGSGTSSQTTLTKTYEAVYTASYYGPDAENGNPNGLRSTATLYQGGETLDGGSENGNQRCVMVFNSDEIEDDFAGYTPTGLTLKLTNQHSWYNSGMTIEFDIGENGAKYPSSAPGSWQGYQAFLVTGTIAEGATHTFSLGAAVAAAFTNNNTNFLGLGAYVAADHPYNLNYYGYFAGGHGTSLEITITGTQSTAGSQNSGPGSDGQVSFTYANEAPYTPPSGTTGGKYGGGGAGSGNMPASPALTVLTVPFSSAATYCGVDATSSPGTPYSVNQQNNPASGVTSVLFAGGQATDSASGTKNSILLLPPSLASMLGNGQYTVEQVYLTLTNAFPGNAAEPILELGYSSDTTLPQTYSGESLDGYIGAIPIPSGSSDITYDLSQSGIGGLLQTGVATALVMGPGATPTFDAYNAPYGPGFYCSVYGPGAYDSYGNAQYPYLTIVLQKTETVQQGSSGSGGAILITAIDNSNVPVANIQPYATTDASGNQFAEGYTGAVVSFDPSITTPGSYVPETWKTVTLPTSGTFAGTIRYKRLAESNFIVIDINVTMTSPTSTGPNAYSTGPMLSEYWPVASRLYVTTASHSNPTMTTGDYFAPYIIVGTNGVIQLVMPQYPSATANTPIAATITVPLD